MIDTTTSHYQIIGKLGCGTRLGVARANALQAKNWTGANPDAAPVRAPAANKGFLVLGKDLDPEIPICQQADAEYAKLH